MVQMSILAIKMGRTVTGLFVQNDLDGLFQENSEIQQLLGGTDTR